jgi:hypothetical protein
MHPDKREELFQLKAIGRPEVVQAAPWLIVAALQPGFAGGSKLSMAAVYDSTTSQKGVPSPLDRIARCRSISGEGVNEDEAGGGKSCISQFGGRGDHSNFESSVRRVKCRPRTARPKGICVVSKTWFISAVRRDGTYQLSATESTLLPQVSSTRR